MHKISIISSSVRIGRNSHRVALYFKHYLEREKLAEVNIIDLNEYKFPIFEERLKYLENPSESLRKFAEEICASHGIIIVTPEYNGGYPPALKNVIDVLYDEWKRKPVAISTVSSGQFGGMQVITSLQFTLWKMHAWTVPVLFPVPNVTKTFDEKGKPYDHMVTDKHAKKFIDELLWYIEAKQKLETT
jgi:NAD(P)H-dependent FMN reductase